MELPRVDNDKFVIVAVGIVFVVLITTVGLYDYHSDKLKAKKIKNFIESGYEQTRLPCGGLAWQKR